MIIRGCRSIVDPVGGTGSLQKMPYSLYSLKNSGF